MKCNISLDGDSLKVVSGYSPILVDRFRAIPGSKPHFANGKFQYWTFPIMPDVVLMTLDVCGLIPAMLDPDVRKVVEDQTKKASPRTPVDRSIINGYEFKTEPYDHQRENFARSLTEDRWLFADEQGTGKSMPLCNRLRTLMAEPRNILVICPKSVVPGWRDQLREHAGLDCVMVVGTMNQKKKKLADSTPIKVAGYETVLSMDESFSEIDWYAIIIDEVQKVKNFTAQVSKCVQRLSEKATCVWALSGTPAPNGLEDWQGVLAAVKPGLLPIATKTAFEARYCFKARVGESGPFKIAGYRNVEELHGYIGSVTSRITKAEALDLPEKVISSRYVEMEGEQARVYRELRKDAVARLVSLKNEGQLTVRNVLSEQLRLLQVVGGFVPDDAGVMHELPSKCKLSAIRDVMDEVGFKQVVIWAAFVEEANFLAKWFADEYGGDAVMLTGQTPDKERSDNIEAFRKGDARWFIGTAGAGGTGVNGLQVCDTEIYYSRNFRLDCWKQSQDRCHRLGSEKTVSVIKLICQNSVDVRVDERLDEKDAQLEMMLRDPGEML